MMRKIFLFICLFSIVLCHSQNDVTVYEINENRSNTKDFDNSYKNKLNIQLNIKSELLKGCKKFKIIKLDDIYDDKNSKISFKTYSLDEFENREIEDRPTIYLEIPSRNAIFLKKISGTIVLYKSDNSILNTINFNFNEVKLP